MEVRPGYKRTEVGVIPQDWEVTALSTLSFMKSGESITSADIDQFSRYPCYGGNGLRGFTTRFTHDGRYALIGRQGALCGNVLGVEGRFFASEHAVVVTPAPQTDIGWLTFVLGEMHLNRYSESSAQPGLSVSKILDLRVGCPPTKAEQEAIATALTDVDALISGLERLIEKKRAIKQGAMQELLTGKRRLPGFSGEWEVKRLEETVGKFVNGGTPSTLHAKYWTGHIPWITGADILNQQVSVVRRYITDEAVRNSSTNVIEQGNLLLVSRTGVGKLAIAPFAVAISQDFTGVYVRDDLLIPEFLFHYFDHNSEILQSQNQGTSIKGITRETLASIPIPIPQLSEQTAIAAVLSDMDVEIAALEARRDKTRLLKQGMMQELLTGRIRLIKPEEVNQ